MMVNVVKICCMFVCMTFSKINHSFEKGKMNQAVVVPTFNPSPWEGEAGGPL